MKQNEGKTYRFLTNHALVLSWLDQHPESTVPETAMAVGFTERTVLKITSELHDAGYLTWRRKGRHNKYRIIGTTPMQRIPGIPGVPVRKLLQVMSNKEKQLAPEA